MVGICTRTQVRRLYIGKQPNTSPPFHIFKAYTLQKKQAIETKVGGRARVVSFEPYDFACNKKYFQVRLKGCSGALNCKNGLSVQGQKKGASVLRGLRGSELVLVFKKALGMDLYADVKAYYS